MCVGVQGVERLDSHGDDDCEHHKDESIEDNECPMNCPVPAKVRMCSSENSLSEYEIDEEQDQDSSADEDRGGYGDFDIVWVASPDNSQDAGHSASHTKAEH